MMFKVTNGYSEEIVYAVRVGESSRAEFLIYDDTGWSLDKWIWIDSLGYKPVEQDGGAE